MSRDIEVYLTDIFEAVEKLLRYSAGLDAPRLRSNEMAFDAIVRNLEVIGEAVKSIPEDFRAAHPEIDWRRIAGLRDILIHEYFGIDNEILWDILVSKVPALRSGIRRILDKE